MELFEDSEINEVVVFFGVFLFSTHTADIGCKVEVLNKLVQVCRSQVSTASRLKVLRSCF